MNTIIRISRQLTDAVLVLAVMTALALTASAAGSASFTTIDYPGAAQTKLYGINQAGDIVGDYRSSDNSVHGFLLRNGVFTSIDYPGAVWTQAWGINTQGDIVGQYGLTSTVSHGFLLRNGVFSNIDLPGMENSMPYKLSENGTVAGCTHGTGYMWGFVTSSAGTTLDSEIMGMHTGINKFGDVTGNYTDPTTGRFIYSYVINRGWKTWFTVPGSYVTRSWDISPNGEVVGFYRDPTPTATRPFHGFLYTNYRRRVTITSIDVNLPGVTGTQAYGINANGDIVGFYNVGSVAHGFLRTSQASQYRPGAK